jgi:hypothetical protein
MFSLLVFARFLCFFFFLLLSLGVPGDTLVRSTVLILAFEGELLAYL